MQEFLIGEGGQLEIKKNGSLSMSKQGAQVHNRTPQRQSIRICMEI